MNDLDLLRAVICPRCDMLDDLDGQRCTCHATPPVRDRGKDVGAGARRYPADVRLARGLKPRAVSA